MEKLNIAKILKDCPTGMKLDCAIYEDVYFDKVNDEDCFYKIACYTLINGVKNSLYFSEFGEFSSYKTAKCVIFPKGKTTWEGFQIPFKDGDVVATFNGNQIFIFKEDAVNEDDGFSGVCYFGCKLQDNHLFKKGTWLFSRHATEEEKQKLFDAIKANGYKWNAETKTLEKLEVSKFDITTLKPFESKVLVRNFGAWEPAFWGYYSKEYLLPFVVVGGNTFSQCIPYKGNEHLLGTTNDCDEYFKTWE